MKILIYGAGAVGGYIGGKLSLAGHQVTLITRQTTADAINQHGLLLSQHGDTTRSEPLAVASVAQAFLNEEQYDLLIMSMKAYDVAEALDPLLAFCPQPPPIIMVQNGIDTEQPVIDQFGAQRVTSAAFTVPVRKVMSHQLAVERDDCGIGLAPTQKGGAIDKWVTMFRKAGITTLETADYHAMKWSKAFMNIIGNASSAILNRPPGVIYQSNSLFDLEWRMLEETLAVMKAKKLEIVELPGPPIGRLAGSIRRMPKAIVKPFLKRQVIGGRGDKMPSFHMDLSRGRRKNEVIYHNGAIARAGDAAGVPTPVNRGLTTVLLKLANERLDWRAFDGKPKRLLAEIRQAAS